MTLELAAPSGGRLRDWTPGLAHRPGAAQRADPAVLAVRRPLGPVHLPRRRPARAGRPRRLRVRARRSWPWATSSASAGPRNNFPLVPSERYLFVAGGIGITPMLPMIAQAELLGADWRLLYGGRRRASMAFLDELAAYGDRVQVGAAGRARAARPARVPRRAAARRPDLLLRPGAAARRDGARLRRLAAAHPAHRAVRRRRDRRRRCAPPRSRSSCARTGTTVTVTPDMTVARRARPGRASRCSPPAGAGSAAPARRRCSRAAPTTATRCSTTTSATPPTACTSASPASCYRPPRPRPLTRLESLP